VFILLKTVKALTERETAPRSRLEFARLGLSELLDQISETYAVNKKIYVACIELNKVWLKQGEGEEGDDEGEEILLQ